MPDSKGLRFLKQRLKKTGRRLKTPKELGLVGSGRPPVSTLYDVPDDQYKQDPLPESASPTGGHALWHKHEGLNRVWAVRFMTSLPDSLDWQFAGVTTGKRKGDESGVDIPTMTARYVYATLKLRLAVTWMIAPTPDSEQIGLRFIRANGETGARWCKLDEVKSVVTTVLNSEYDSVDPKNPRRSWL